VRLKKCWYKNALHLADAVDWPIGEANANIEEKRLCCVIYSEEREGGTEKRRNNKAYYANC
jgi:hypothetical protein